MASLPMFVVDAFTIGNNQVFSGSPAGICILNYDDDVQDETKQQIAAQMNLPVTVFIAKGWTSSSKPSPKFPHNRWTIRWFTTLREVPLCGHASMATAHAVFHQLLKNGHCQENNNHKRTTIIFETKHKGELKASCDYSTGLITLDFPANPPVPLSSVGEVDSEPWIHQMIVNTLGQKVSPELVEDVQLSPGLGYLQFTLRNTGNVNKNVERLQNVNPNFRALLMLDTGSFKMFNVIVTIQGSSELLGQKPQFYSRVFAPWIGLDEDPFCGSAHTVMTPYWIKKLKQQGLELQNDAALLGRQLSSRVGQVLCKLNVDDNRVYLTGQSRLIMSCKFYL